MFFGMGTHYSRERILVSPVTLISSSSGLEFFPIFKRLMLFLGLTSGRKHAEVTPPSPPMGVWTRQPPLACARSGMWSPEGSEWKKYRQTGTRKGLLNLLKILMTYRTAPLLILKFSMPHHIPWQNSRNVYRRHLYGPLLQSLSAWETRIETNIKKVHRCRYVIQSL